ncbi:MAG: cation diffusion facilitator family transporter [Myxococcales bacterium]|nr:cation diffusion facilitator family transporter [Myxococcales bacterium]
MSDSVAQPSAVRPASVAIAPAHHPTGHIVQSLVVNMVIALSKLVGAVLSGSGAMLAETLHSCADCGNQALLLLGVKRATKPPDAAHPLGYGAALYFWSFMVALLLFVGGGMFSLYEGVHKLQHPEPLHDTKIAMAILMFSIVLEGWSCRNNIIDLNKGRGTMPFVQYLRQTKDSDLIVVFGENAAAVLGLIIAAVFMQIAVVTGDPRYDAVGSLGIGLVLIGVALFLAVEVKSLLMGERAGTEVERAVHQAAADDPKIAQVLRVITVQKGPNEVLVACKLQLVGDLDTAGVVQTINAFETRLHALCPEVRWSFVEPDDKE